MLHTAKHNSRPNAVPESIDQVSAAGNERDPATVIGFVDDPETADA